LENEYDFSSGERGAVVPDAVRITLCLDNDVLDWFRAQVDASGGGDYQSLIRAAVRDHIQQRREPLEETLRRVIREELNAADWTAEAERRYEELRSGAVEGVPAEDVFARIRSRLSGPETCLQDNDGEYGSRE
jgi:hypothetical protein